MVSPLWALISASLGALGYLLIPMLAASADIERRQRVGRWYSDLAMKSFRQLAFVDRVFGGYDLLRIGVDDERGMAEVTLSSGIIGDDKKLPFKDPANCVKRLHGKPVALLIEDLPAAISAELAELGHWVREHDEERGLVDDAEVQPYVEMDDGLRCVNPRDVLAITGQSVEPETVETAKKLTKKRFSEYAGRVGAVEIGATFTGFMVGAGGYAFLQYVRTSVLDGAGGSPGVPSSPIPLHMMGDLVVMLA